MAEENSAGATGAAVGPSQGQGDSNTISNSQAKELPWVREMAAKLKALEEEKAAREQAAAEEKRKAEIAKATSEQNYEKALLLEQEKTTLAERKVKEAEQKALFSEVKATLISKGAKGGDGFFKVAFADYDPTKHASLDAFAEAIKTNADYAPFFQGGERTPYVPPKGAAPSGKNQNSVDWEQIRKMAEDTSWVQPSERAKREEARKAIRDYRDSHNGEYPYKT